LLFSVDALLFNGHLLFKIKVGINVVGELVRAFFVQIIVFFSLAAVVVARVSCNGGLFTAVVRSAVAIFIVGGVIRAN
jgi:hypothetical protein